MRNKSIVVIGSSNTDMVVRTDRMPKPGETLLGGDFLMTLGGKGANQAVAAARLGGNVTFICKVGDDIFGRNALDMYRKEGLNIDFACVSETKPSGVALINVDGNGENSIVVASGANAELSRNDIDAAAEAIRKASVVIMQLECPIDTVCYAAKLASDSGVPVILNPAPAPTEALPDELLRNIDLCIPNETEAELISGVSVADDESAIKAIECMKSKGIKDVILTMGSRGAMICEDGEYQLVPAFKVKAVDTTAAGDTFCGALGVALSEGKPLRDATLFANKASSISVQRMGAISSLPVRDEVE